MFGSMLALLISLFTQANNLVYNFWNKFYKMLNPEVFSLGVSFKWQSITPEFPRMLSQWHNECYLGNELLDVHHYWHTTWHVIIISNLFLFGFIFASNHITTICFTRGCIPQLFLCLTRGRISSFDSFRGRLVTLFIWFTSGSLLTVCVCFIRGSLTSMLFVRCSTVCFLRGSLTSLFIRGSLVGICDRKGMGIFCFTRDDRVNWTWQFQVFRQ